MDGFEPVADVLRQASRVVVLSGAGMSAESGIPTFRDKHTGLWEHYDPAELASTDAWAASPDVVWGWYLWRTSILRQAKPHGGYSALARWANDAPRLNHQLTFVTQNVDTLHEQSLPTESPSVLAINKLHGTLEEFRCSQCNQRHAEPIELPMQPTERVQPPTCVHCGGCIRPGVVWFGEHLPHDPWEKSIDAVRAGDVLLVVGTSSVVYPAAMLPELAADLGKTVIEMNLVPTPLSHHATHVLRAKAGEGLPLLVDLLTGT